MRVEDSTATGSRRSRQSRSPTRRTTPGPAAAEDPALARLRMAAVSEPVEPFAVLRDAEPTSRLRAPSASDWVRRPRRSWRAWRVQAPPAVRNASPRGSVLVVVTHSLEHEAERIEPEGRVIGRRVLRKLLRWVKDAASELHGPLVDGPNG